MARLADRGIVVVWQAAWGLEYPKVVGLTMGRDGIEPSASAVSRRRSPAELAARVPVLVLARTLAGVVGIVAVADLAC